MLITENLMSLVNILNNKDEYDLEIKNIDAINSSKPLKKVVVKVNKGNVEKLQKSITDLYAYEVENGKDGNTFIFSLI